MPNTTSSTTPRLAALVLQRAGELGLSHVQRRILQDFEQWAELRMAGAGNSGTEALEEIRERTGLLLLQTLASWQFARVRALRREADKCDTISHLPALARAA